jgi:hypothetical protein
LQCAYLDFGQIADFHAPRRMIERLQLREPLRPRLRAGGRRLAQTRAEAVHAQIGKAAQTARFGVAHAAALDRGIQCRVMFYTGLRRRRRCLITPGLFQGGASSHRQEHHGYTRYTS